MNLATGQIAESALALEPPARSRPHRAAWPAILAGAVAALAVQVLWSLLGTSIGMSTVELLRANGTSSTYALGIGAGMWWILSSCVALGVGGWIAAHLAGCRGKLDGALHGVLAWGVTTLVGVFLVGSVLGSMVNRAAGILGTVSSTGVDSPAAAPPRLAPGVQLGRAGHTWDAMKHDAASLVQANQPESPPSGMEKTDRQDTSPTKRWEAPSVPANTAAGLGESQAERRTRELAAATARATARIALWSFIALLLSAAAAALGGLAESLRRHASVRRPDAQAAAARRVHVPGSPLLDVPVGQH